jgi:CRISPR-associated protein Cmr6
MAYILTNHEHANLGWLYYKDYFRGTKPRTERNDALNNINDTLENRNYTILQRGFEPYNDAFSISGARGFTLYCSYPGLFTGSGYTHEYTKEDDKKDAFKTGFFFDHVTGMPCLPGHSIKGPVRAAFPKGDNDRYKNEKAKYIVQEIIRPNISQKPEDLYKDYLGKIGIENAGYSIELFVDLLSNIMFEGKKPVHYEDNKFHYQQMGLYEKDVFYDAYIVNGGADGRFLDSDYITHHEHPLKNPNPVKFLKLAPGVGVKFQFKFSDNLLSAGQKESICKAILLDFGAGAKTNTGYGQFSEEPFFEQGTQTNTVSSLAEKGGSNKNAGKSNVRNEVIDTKAATVLKKGKQFTGSITGEKTGYFEIEFQAGGFDCTIFKKNRKMQKMQ